jgi:hypothetical protein
MTRSRLWGFVLLALSGSSIIGAVAIGVLAAMQEWDRERIVALTAALAIFAEICFWMGGGLVGLSAIQRRRVTLGRLAARVGLRRRG